MSARRIRWVFWSLTFLQWFPVGFLLPVLVLTMDERGIGLGQIGVTFAAYGVTTAILELPTGSLADAMGRKPVLILATVLHTAMAILWLFGATFPLFLVGAVVGGVGRALSTGPLEAWYVDSVREIDPNAPIRRGLAGAGVANALGIALSSLTVAGLSSIPGLVGDGPVISALRLPPLLAALSSFAHFMAISSLIEERREHLTSTRAVMAAIPRTMRRVLRLAVGPGRMRLILLTMAMIGIALASVEMLYQPMFSDMMDSTTSATRLFGFLAFGLAMSAGVGSAFAGAVPENRSHPAAVASGALLACGVAIIAFGQAGSVLPAAVLFLAIYVLNGFFGPFVEHLLHSESTSAERSTMVSAGSLSIQSGVLVTGTVVAQIAARSSIPAAITVAGIVMFTACILLGRLFLRHREPVPANPKHTDGVPRDWR